MRPMVQNPSANVLNCCKKADGFGTGLYSSLRDRAAFYIVVSTGETADAVCQKAVRNRNDRRFVCVDEPSIGLHLTNIKAVLLMP